MSVWTQTTPFESKKNQKEKWICKDKETEQCYDVDVTLGKPIDILSLKLSVIEDFSAKVDEVKNSRTAFFQGELERVKQCPICKADTTNFLEDLNIYGAKYTRCLDCSHHFIIARPTQEAIEKFYKEDETYQQTYADKKTTETRVQQVGVPKAKWTVKQFERVYGRKPKAILDVGAGSGHFVKACRDLGMKADGIELSESGRQFCKNNFGFELIKKDFVKEWRSFQDYELVTFWGVIEHVPNPMKMLSATSKLLAGKEGLVVAEVPRWNCFSTTVQSIFSNSIVRHFDPLGHINVFTDSSLATAFKSSGFDITSAWYFGMDAYELVTQISNLLKDDDVLQKIGQYIPTFQERLDLAKLSDEMVFVGKPAEDDSSQQLNHDEGEKT